jgi:hypothetical protein
MALRNFEDNAYYMKELQRGDGERRDVFFFKMTTFIATLAP